MTLTIEHHYGPHSFQIIELSPTEINATAKVYYGGFSGVIKVSTDQYLDFLLDFDPSILPTRVGSDFFDGEHYYVKIDGQEVCHSTHGVLPEFEKLWTKLLSVVKQEYTLRRKLEL
ncbi:hypothetical protein [uncultured Roseivirga sp.]|uniref:hypothetical protein n=1 Tax=uncultured Roseivirga sp. TaxID=543088 RepID=UPI000D7900CB|nr:hypothetical protein [uncultured Roseivirga sp.]PWL24588.1 MAG: hypothetical protein DCO95_18550 [Roseivirga sp. XM-24bin3]